MMELLSVWFAYPALLGFLAVLPGLVVLLLDARAPAPGALMDSWATPPLSKDCSSRHRYRGSGERFVCSWALSS